MDTTIESKLVKQLNPNFAFDDLDEAYQDAYKDWTSSDGSDVIYARPDFDGSTVVIVSVNEKFETKVYRLFKFGQDSPVQISVDCEVAPNRFLKGFAKS